MLQCPLISFLVFSEVWFDSAALLQLSQRMEPGAGCSAPAQA